MFYIQSVVSSFALRILVKKKPNFKPEKYSVGVFKYHFKKIPFNNTLR